MNEVNNIEDELAFIRNYIENELHHKTKIILKQHETIESLIAQRNKLVAQQEDDKAALTKAQQLAEAKKQLVDKLLGDIARLQQDVEWYKRTYEQRSFLGYLREKLRK